MGRYGEVKSVYLGKFKRRVHHTCHHNVIVYQQTGNRAILRRESTAYLLHDAYTGTPPLALHTAARDQFTNTSPSTLHTHLRLRLTVTHKHTITIIIISVQHRCCLRQQATVSCEERRVTLQRGRWRERVTAYATGWKGKDPYGKGACGTEVRTQDTYACVCVGCIRTHCASVAPALPTMRAGHALVLVCERDWKPHASALSL